MAEGLSVEEIRARLLEEGEYEEVVDDLIRRAVLDRWYRDWEDWEIEAAARAWPYVKPRFIARALCRSESGVRMALSRSRARGGRCLCGGELVEEGLPTTEAQTGSGTIRWAAVCRKCGQRVLYAFSWVSG